MLGDAPCPDFFTHRENSLRQVLPYARRQHENQLAEFTEKSGESAFTSYIRHKTTFRIMHYYFTGCHDFAWAKPSVQDVDFTNNQ
jgi:hypothetical protein